MMTPRARRADAPSLCLSRRGALVRGGLGLAGVLAGVSAGSRAAARQATPAAMEEGSFSPDEQLALESIVAETMAAEHSPGTVAGVWASGRGIWMHAAGIGNLETATPIAVTDHFRIGSVTKTFAATVLLQLIDEGLVTLDDTLESFVPGIPNGPEITMRQLLGMTAGIFNYVEDPAFEAAYVADPVLPFPPQEAIAIIQRHEPDFAPGTDTAYSDSNYILIGLILEHLTGQSAAAAITERIITPLGLTGTSFPMEPAMPSPYAHGYAADPCSEELRDLTESNPNVAWTAGGMISTLADLRVWGKALAEGALLSPETQRERLQINPLSAAPGFSLGYGLGIMDLNGFLGHSGAIFGYSTWLLHSPALDATIAVLVNRGETTTGFGAATTVDIGHELFPEAFPRAAATPAPVREAE